jgi:release factor glutamine methyltransferase
MSSEPPKQWTTRALLAWIESHLEGKGVDAPRVQARHLVAEVIGCDVITLFTDPDRATSKQERETLRGLVTRAAEGAPLQQILGRSGFMLRDFEVTPDVLVPRDATESLVRAVLTWHRGIEPSERPQPLDIIDVGTGTGCIAITLALELEHARVRAIDCSAEALDVARTNIERHGVGDRVKVMQGDGLHGVKEAAHVIVSNPPYISDDRFQALDPVVREHEPAVALRGGADGLDVIRPLVEAAPASLHPGGLLALEVDDWHAADVARCCDAAGLQDARVLKDAWGDDRIVIASKSDS